MDVRNCFNVLPILEAHIEDLIGLQFLKAQQKISEKSDSCKQLSQDNYVQLNIDHWETKKANNTPSVLQQLCTAAKKYKHYLSSNYYFPLLPPEDNDIKDNLTSRQ